MPVWSDVRDQLVTRPRRVLSAVRTSAGRRGVRLGVFPGYVHQRIIRSTRPGFIVDVGANRGQFALDCLTVIPGVTVVAFEPLGTEAAVFRRLLAREPSVSLREVAIGAAVATSRMEVSAKADSSSLLPITPTQVAAFPGTQRVRWETVEVSTLDAELVSMGPSPRLLKIDVQGLELEVLRGGDGVLSMFEWIYLELSLAEFYRGQPDASPIVAHLLDRGFRLADIGHTSRRLGRCVQFDALFSGPDASPLSALTIHTTG